MTARPFPTFDILDLKGKTYNMKHEKGLFTIVHFWSTWCVPCVEELPQLLYIQKLYGDRGLKVFAISMDGEKNADKVQKFLTAHDLEALSTYLDIGTAGFRKVKARGLPSTYFLNGKGQLIAFATGKLNWKSKEIKGFLGFHIAPQMPLGRM